MMIILHHLQLQVQRVFVKRFFQKTLAKHRFNPIYRNILILCYSSIKNNMDRFHHWDMYWDLLKFRLLQTNQDELRNIYEVEEGIENRILHLPLNVNPLHNLCKQLKTKRYTWTRLQRTLTHILTHTTKKK